MGQYNKLKLLVVGLCAALLIGGSILTSRTLVHDYDETTVAAGRHAQYVAIALEEHIRRVVGEVDAVLLSTSDLVGNQRQGGEKRPLSLPQTMKRWATRLPQLNAISVIDAEGQLVYDSNDPTPLRLDLRKREYFTTQKKTPDQGLYVGKLLVSKSDGRWFIPLSRALKTKDGRFDGVVVALFSPVYFNGFRKTVDLAETDSISVFHRDGTMLARTPFGYKLVNKSFSDDPLFTKSIKDSAVGVSLGPKGSDGVVRIVAHRVMESLPFVVTVGLSESTILTRWQLEQRTLLWVIGGGAAVIVFLGFLVFRQLTKIERSEQVVQDREELYRQMFETNSAIKLLIDPEDGSLVDVNDAAVRFYGFSKTQLTAMRISDINTLSASEVRAEMELAKAKDKLFFQFKHRLASGEIRDVEVYTGPVTVHNRTLLHSIITDVTDRNSSRSSLEEQRLALERSNAELQQFAYVASHDLQEPLRMITSYIQLLDRKIGDTLDPDSKEFMDYAVNGAKRMSVLIKDLLVYSRVESKTRPFEQVELAEVVEMALINLNNSILETKAEVTVHDLPTVSGDYHQLTSLFQNLIVNGLKYAREGETPNIVVGAREDEADWVVYVRDRGIGIETVHFNRIFRIFQRLHGQGKYEGTGIGLAICKRISEAHGGTIWVESQEGEGATFYVSFPMSNMAEA